MGKRGLVALFSLSSCCIVTFFSLSRPSIVIGWSVVCDCYMSWLYALALKLSTKKGLYIRDQCVLPWALDIQKSGIAEHQSAAKHTIFQ